MKYTGFEEYTTTGKITNNFINDFKYWCRKYYKRWTLFLDFEEFYSRCWERLLERLPNFDPNIATIQTLCISTANNECWRTYMSTKTSMSHPEDDIDDPSVNYDLGKEEELNIAILLQQMMKEYGVHASIQDISNSYNQTTLIGQALVWLQAKELLVSDTNISYV